MGKSFYGDLNSCDNLSEKKCRVVVNGFHAAGLRGLEFCRNHLKNRRRLWPGWRQSTGHRVTLCYFSHISFTYPDSDAYPPESVIFPFKTVTDPPRWTSFEFASRLQLFDSGSRLCRFFESSPKKYRAPSSAVIRGQTDHGSGGSNSTEVQESISGWKENKVILPGSLFSSSGEATTYKTPLILKIYYFQNWETSAKIFRISSIGK